MQKGLSKGGGEAVRFPHDSQAKTTAVCCAANTHRALLRLIEMQNEHCDMTSGQ